ncbi:MAG: anion permease [Gammaproteobacteria bacterium]|nr:anion permease [Gammaproteobacteria bacterium]
MESLAVVLRRVPLFADLPPGSFAKIIADLREEVVEPGTVICTEGEPANDFFLIRSGEVSVYVNHVNGERELIDTVGANHTFGEAALFRERRRAATIVAHTRVDLWRLPKDKFATVIDENPGLVLHFTGILLDRLHNENRQIARLLQMSRAQARAGLARESSEELIALECLSILETLHPVAVAALLGNMPHATTLVKSLIDRSDYVEQSELGPHLIPAVREVLSGYLRARIGSDAVRGLHSRVAAALAAADQQALAIDHWFAAGEIHHAVKAITDSFAGLIATDGISRIDDWLTRVPHTPAHEAQLDDLRRRIADLHAAQRAQRPRPVAQRGARHVQLLDGLLAIGAGLLLAFVIPMPGLSAEGRDMLALLAVAVVLWARDTLPDYVVGLGMMIAWIVLNIVPSQVALSGFTSSPFFLITGVLGMAAGLQASGLLFRLTLHIIRRFPPTHLGQMTGLSLSGTAVTSVVPDVTSGVAIAAPITLALSDSLGFGRRSRGSTSIAMAAVLGFGQMSPFFLTGAAENLLGRALLPSAAQETVTWTGWLVAALPLALVTFLCGLTVTYLLYRPQNSPRISRAMVDAQLEALGRPSRAEIVNGSVLGAAVIGWLTSPMHGIDVAWVAMAGLLVLLAANMLDRAAFRASIYWDFLFYLGTVLSLTGVVHELGVDAWLIDLIKPHVEPLVRHPATLLLLLALSIYAARFVLPSFPLVSLLVLTIVPITSAAGFHPMVLLLVISTAVSVWFMPYQSAYYLALYFGTKEQAFSHRQARPMAWAYGVIYLLAIAAGIPLWRWLGMLPGGTG